MRRSRRSLFQGTRRSLVFAAFPLFFLLAIVATAGAQTVRPVVVEYSGKHVKGRFELANDGLVPLAVVLEPRGFDVSDSGEAIYQPLDPRVHLRLSQMSVRIPPKQSRYIFFEATTDSLPAWFVIPCTFAAVKRGPGLDVRLELPHTVYLLQPEPLRREDVHVVTAVYSPQDAMVFVELQNQSPRLGRATQVEVRADGKTQVVASFPLLPGHFRRIVVPWNAPQVPERLSLKFPAFTLEVPLSKAASVVGR